MTLTIADAVGHDVNISDLSALPHERGDRLLAFLDDCTPAQKAILRRWAASDHFTGISILVAVEGAMKKTTGGEQARDLGILLLTHCVRGALEIDLVLIRTEARRRQIGTKLWKHALQICDPKSAALTTEACTVLPPHIVFPCLPHCLPSVSP